MGAQRASPEARPWLGTMQTPGQIVRVARAAPTWVPESTEAELTDLVTTNRSRSTPLLDRRPVFPAHSPRRAAVIAATPRHEACLRHWRGRTPTTAEPIVHIEPTPSMDTRGRNILQLIEQSIQQSDDLAEREAAEALLARVREAHASVHDDRATIPDLNPYAHEFRDPYGCQPHGTVATATERASSRPRKRCHSSTRARRWSLEVRNPKHPGRLPAGRMGGHFENPDVRGESPEPCVTVSPPEGEHRPRRDVASIRGHPRAGDGGVHARGLRHGPRPRTKIDGGRG